MRLQRGFVQRISLSQVHQQMSCPLPKQRSQEVHLIEDEKRQGYWDWDYHRDRRAEGPFWIFVSEISDKTSRLVELDVRVTSC